ncbi:DUF1648 domain-containing protein [Thermoflavimicrobium daqui]|uniref:DUF1648 domain-containing protein n=1 Tax=Thermoflavimicrobium daqui TaxID=2137476 RepID=A0A364K9H2_9BACL|nr:DUF5808 domain-containing protein [Thermoflavimicrobium daqui]RAL26928.1 hypothetical protein DL897_02455 [Thermoflavimicrobium daqui]
MNNISELLPFYFGLIFPLIFAIFQPYITRKTESFGVSIPEEFYNDPGIIAFRKRYSTILSIFAIFMLILFTACIFSISLDKIGTCFAILLIVEIILSYLIYWQFHKKMKDLKLNKELLQDKKQRRIVDSSFHQQKLTYSNRWLLIPFVIAVGTYLLSLFFYEQIPEQIPIRYNFDNQVTAYKTKSYGTLLQIPLIQLFITGIFLFVNISNSKGKQQLTASNPQKSLQQNILFRRKWSLWSIISPIIFTLSFLLIQLNYIIPIPPNLLGMVLLFTIAIVIIWSVILSFKLGQGGSRISEKETTINPKIVNIDDDRYWKAGIFYFNPKDPTLIVEKRFGIGWTFNFARPLAWLILVLILVVPLLPLLLQ